MENSRATKGADYAAEIIATMARETRQYQVRVSMCKLAISHGNYTPAAKELFRIYLGKNCPANT